MEKRRRGRTGHPLISVLVPVFNAQATVGAALQSVLAQTYEDWELIAIDDGSTDGSYDVIANYAKGDDRICVVRQANGGAASARNSGIRVARGQFCALLDADDLWLPSKLEKQVPRLQEGLVVFSDTYVEEGGTRYAWGDRVDRPGGVYPRGAVLDSLLQQNFIPALTVVLPTNLLREVGGFDNVPPYEDWDLWLRLALRGVQFDYIPAPLAVYRVRPDSYSSDPEATRRATVEVIRRLYRHADGTQRSAAKQRFRTAKRELEVYLRKRAWVAAAGGDAGAARRDLFASLRGNPWSSRALAGACLALAPPSILRRVAQHRPPPNFAGSFVRE